MGCCSKPDVSFLFPIERSDGDAAFYGNIVAAPAASRQIPLTGGVAKHLTGMRFQAGNWLSTVCLSGITTEIIRIGGAKHQCVLVIFFPAIGVGDKEIVKPVPTNDIRGFKRTPGWGERCAGRTGERILNKPPMQKVV